MNFLSRCTSKLVAQHSCQVSFKSMQGCRRSWEDKLKCIKILSVKDHNCKNLSNMSYLLTCISRLVVQHPCQVLFKSMQGCRRSWDDKLWWDGITEGWTKQILNAPVPFYDGVIIKRRPWWYYKSFEWNLLSKGLHKWTLSKGLHIQNNKAPSIIVPNYEQGYKLKLLFLWMQRNRLKSRLTRLCLPHCVGIAHKVNGGCLSTSKKLYTTFQHVG